MVSTGVGSVSEGSVVVTTGVGSAGKSGVTAGNGSLQQQLQAGQYCRLAVLNKDTAFSLAAQGFSQVFIKRFCTGERENGCCAADKWPQAADKKDEWLLRSR